MNVVWFLVLGSAAKWRLTTGPDRHLGLWASRELLGLSALLGLWALLGVWVLR